MRNKQYEPDGFYTYDAADEEQQPRKKRTKSKGTPLIQFAGQEVEPREDQVSFMQRMTTPFRMLGTAVDRAFPNPKNRDEMAIYLAQRTPRALAICIGLLLAGVIASRLQIWEEGFLWGIPSLGAISMGVGWWVWSTNIAAGRLSPEVREAVNRAIRLQYVMLLAFVVGIVYFLGMAARWW